MAAVVFFLWLSSPNIHKLYTSSLPLLFLLCLSPPLCSHPSPPSTCSLVQDPHGPAIFYTHARNNATPFCCGVCRQVNSRRFPSFRRYAVKTSVEKYSLPPSDRRQRTCRPITFSTSFLNFWMCPNTSLFCRIG